jgi:predicted RNA-binding Zn ribbon-like protein
MEVTDPRVEEEEVAASAAGTMKLVGGDLCLDFVNTVGGRDPAVPRSASAVRDDKIGSYADLVAWSRHAAEASEARARELTRLAARRPADAAAVVVRARRLREALHRVLLALTDGARPEPDDVRLLNDEVAAARQRERLVPAGDGLRWEAMDAEELLESVLWPVARAAADLVTSGDLSRLRRCAGDGCGWLFLDQSRNRSRQWCTMEDCGNVSKVRRFRKKRRRPPRLAPGASRP